MTASGFETGYINCLQVTASGDYNSTKYAPNASKTNFTIDLGTNVQKVSKVSFHSVSFRNNAYNVNSTGNGKNNTFAFTVNGSTVDAEVDEGWYDTKTLMAAVQTIVQAELTSAGDGQTFTVSQNSLSGKVSVSYTEGTSGNPTMTIEDADSKRGIWELLGFDAKTPLTVTDGTPLVATNLPALGGLTMVFLESKALSPGNMIDVGGTQKCYSLAIPVTAGYGYENVWECKVDKLCEITYPSQRNLQLVDFALVDKDGVPIDFHGAGLIVNFRVWFDRF